MAIEIIDTLKPKNNKDFPVAKSENIGYDSEMFEAEGADNVEKCIDILYNMITKGSTFYSYTPSTISIPIDGEIKIRLNVKTLYSNQCKISVSNYVGTVVTVYSRESSKTGTDIDVNIVPPTNPGEYIYYISVTDKYGNSALVDYENNASGRTNVQNDTMLKFIINYGRARLTLTSADNILTYSGSGELISTNVEMNTSLDYPDIKDVIYKYSISNTKLNIVEDQLKPVHLEESTALYNDENISAFDLKCDTMQDSGGDTIILNTEYTVSITAYLMTNSTDNDISLAVDRSNTITFKLVLVKDNSLTFIVTKDLYNANTDERLIMKFKPITNIPELRDVTEENSPIKAVCSIELASGIDTSDIDDLDPEEFEERYEMKLMGATIPTTEFHGLVPGEEITWNIGSILTPGVYMYTISLYSGDIKYDERSNLFTITNGPVTDTVINIVNNIVVNLIKNYIGNHNDSPNVHQYIINKLTEIENKYINIYNMIAARITTNVFTVTFETLNDIELMSGVWDETNARLVY